MTTIVTVNAHCSPNKEVIISATAEPDRVIQDGESAEVYTYDDRVISVREVNKDRNK